MKTRSKNIIIHSTPEKIFSQMDDFSKTGMHMSQSSMMMMGSKLSIEQVSTNVTGVGAKVRWYGKIMGMKLTAGGHLTHGAKPNISGDRVILDITAYQNRPSSSPFDVNTTRISTTVAGKLGEWIRLGGSSQQEGDNRGSIGNYAIRSGTNDRQVWLKVEAGP